MPSELQKLFIILTSTTEQKYSENDGLIKAIRDYLNVLQYIDLKKSFENQGVLVLASSLQEFVFYLQNIVDDLKCLVRLFNFLHDESNSYNVTFFEKKQFSENTKSIDHIFASTSFKYSSLLLLTEQISSARKGCDCFIGLYRYCFVAIIYLNQALETNYVLDTKNSYYSEAIINITQIKNYLFYILNQSSNLSHYKVIYNILPLIELLENDFTEDLFDLKRLIYVIMTELNTYAIDFCNPPDYNFLLFNNLDFDTIGQLSSVSINDEIRGSINLMPNTSTNNVNCKYLSMRSLSDLLISSQFYRYDDVINLNWKGEKRSVGYIIHCMMNAVISPSAVYSLYDVYLKFSLAVVYFEVYNRYEKKYNNLIFTQVKDITKLISTVFTKVILNIDALMDYLVVPQKYIPWTLVIKLTNEIKNQFETIGIFLQLKELIPTNCNTNISAVNDDTDQQMTSDFNTTLKNINSLCFFTEKVNEHVSNNCLYG